MKNPFSIVIYVSLLLIIPTGCGEKKTENNLEEDVDEIENLTCQEATDESNAFKVYKQVHSALIKGDSTDKIRYLDCLLQSEDISTSAAETLENFTRKVFNSDVLYRYLDNEYDEILFNYNNPNKERTGVRAWIAFHITSAAITAYQKTGEKRFIDQYVRFFTQIMKLRDSDLGIMDDYHNQVMNAWGSSKFGEDKWVALVTHFAVLMGPATRTAVLINSDPNLTDFTWFSDLITDYYNNAFLAFDVDLKQVENSDVMWYWRPWENKYEAINHIHLLGESLINMYALTKNDLYYHRVEWIISVFEKSAIIDENGLVAWNYYPYFQTDEAMKGVNARGYSEKTWKAGLTIPFIYQADAAGFNINKELVNATTKTIRNHILANNGISSNLHPQGSVAIENDKRNKKSRYEEAITLFLSASEKDSSISRIILNTIATRPDLFQDGWMTKKMIRGYAHYLKSDSTSESTK